MKKNKTIAFVMAAGLLVGGTFVGTKALFTDKGTRTGDLVINTGSLKLQVSEREGWMVKTPGGKTETIVAGNELISNAKPGDKFLRAIEVKNIGTLTQKLSIEGGDDQNLKDWLKINVTKDDIQNRTLVPNEGVGFLIEVEVLEAMENGEQSKTFDLNTLMSEITINAEQLK
ncbi:hypothetical protein [Romboutsia sp.]|uniref:hypothetical protein n=1 Tax=Romboutsia sp. TaxID=1965302 RepID=UPI003F36D4C4